MGNNEENGPVIVTLFDPQTPTGPINGEDAYFNVPTLTNPGGEIRGIIKNVG